MTLRFDMLCLLLWTLFAGWSCEGPTVAPVGMVQIQTDGALSAFWIDKYEYPNKRGEFPLTSTDLSTAKNACEQEGKRLCTAAEWRRACLGASGRLTYGYGDRYIPNACHTEQQLASGHTSMMDAKELVAASGAWRACETPEGVVDLVGNVEEWVLDDWRGIGGMLEGGAWYTNKAYADCTGRYSREPDYRITNDQPVFSAGFRCCLSDKEPTAADIGADAKRRLDTARQSASQAPYDPSNEIAVAPNLFVDRFEYPNRAGQMPLVAVTWEEAKTACINADKRLCEAWEWESICGGESRDAFPYGPGFMNAACAVNLSSPATSGRHAGCQTLEGVTDMVGSVWEWTNTPLDVDSLTVAGLGGLREIRGGSWFVDPEKGVCRPADGYPAASEKTAFFDVGFRCCRGDGASKTAMANPESETISDTDAKQCPEGTTLITPIDPDSALAGFCIDLYEHPNRAGQTPRGDLDWPTAERACRGRALRVCTEQEWSLACEGVEGRRWPYGQTYVSGTCHLREEPKLVGRVDASGSGSHKDCATPEGVMDLSGNLWEWTASALPDADGKQARGALRGGGWNFSAGMGQCRARASARPDYALAQTGVRCCTEPLPSTDAP